MSNWTDEQLQEHIGLARSKENSYGRWATMLAFVLALLLLLAMIGWYLLGAASTVQPLLFVLLVPLFSVLDFSFEKLYWQRERHNTELLLEMRKQKSAREEAKRVDT